MEQYIEELVPFINTILLAILFIFQKNKSNLLLKEMESQKAILDATQELVKQQARIIEGLNR